MPKLGGIFGHIRTHPVDKDWRYMHIGLNNRISSALISFSKGSTKRPGPDHAARSLLLYVHVCMYEGGSHARVANVTLELPWFAHGDKPEI